MPRLPRPVEFGRASALALLALSLGGIPVAPLALAQHAATPTASPVPPLPRFGPMSWLVPDDLLDGLGSGAPWSVTQRDAGVAPGSPLADTARATYQNGAAVALVIILEPGPDPAAVQQVEANLGGTMLGRMPGTTGIHEATGTPPPAGCANAQRWVATATSGGVAFPVGSTLCIVGPELHIFALVIGRIGTDQGALAADDVVREVLRHRTMATPPASPAA